MGRSKAASSLAIVSLLGGCGYAASGPAKVATVNNKVLTERDLAVAVRSTEVVDRVSLSSNPSAKRMQIHQLIQQSLVKDWALSHHVISSAMAGREATHFISTKVSPPLGGPSGLSRSLKTHQLTAKEFQQFVSDQMVLQAAFSRVTQHTAPLKSGQGYAFYRAHRSQFVTPNEKLAREIVVSTHKDATSIETQLMKGANFSALARRDSKNTSTATMGGSLGWIKLGVATTLPASVAKAIQGLAPGHYSIVPTHLGYAIIEVETAKPGHSIPYSQVRPEIQAQLMQSAKTVTFQHWANQLEKSAHIKLYQNG